MQTVALLRTADGDTAGAAHAIHTAIDHDARVGDRNYIAADVTVSVIVLAGDRHGLSSAATLSGAAAGPALGHIPAFTAANHRERYERAVTDVAAAVGADAFARAQADGAAMTYEEIIAYTLDQLDRLTDP